MHLVSKRGFAVISVLVLALVFLVPSISRGSENDRLTHFSINQKFEVPGKVLEANTKYVMRLNDVDANKRVVQILTDDEQHLVAQFLAINAQRMESQDKTVFTFYETRAGFPKPIREWFYPARVIGLEFIYPKEQMTEIASHMGPAPAVTATAAVVAPVVSEPEAVITPEPEETVQIAENQGSQDLKTEPEIVREKPAEEPVLTEQQPAVTEPETQQTAVNEAKELPRTAGELPLIGLIGMLSLGFGFGLKALSVK